MFELSEPSLDGKFMIRELKVTVPWGYIQAKCWGKPFGQPVLVVHGVQDNAGSFDRLIPLLPGSFFYVCIDLPGHGKSSHLPGGIALNLMQYISSINRFVRLLSWTQFYYLGHSLGGQLGMYYAAMYPEQVIKLITLDTLPLFNVPTDDLLNEFSKMNDKLINLELKLARGSPPGYTHEEALERLIKGRPSRLIKPAGEALLERALKRNEKGFCFSTDQRLKFGIRHPVTIEQNITNMKKVQCPFLLILTRLFYTAVQSEGFSDGSKELLNNFSSMKNVSIVLVDGNHDVHNNTPEEVALHIRKFLNLTKSHL